MLASVVSKKCNMTISHHSLTCHHQLPSTETGVNAPLYDQNDSPEFSVHGCVENWKEGKE